MAYDVDVSLGVEDGSCPWGRPEARESNDADVRCFVGIRKMIFGGFRLHGQLGRPRDHGDEVALGRMLAIVFEGEGGCHLCKLSD